MLKFKINDGYIRFDGDVVNFYDARVDGSAFITLQQVKQAIREYEESINN